MSQKLSKRLEKIVESLSLKPGMRVLEIGCGPGAMAREMALRVGPKGFVLAIDRSAKAISQAKASSRQMRNLQFVKCAAEEFEHEGKSFDLAVAVRVGAFDGRHPELEAEARRRINKALKPRARFVVE